MIFQYVILVNWKLYVLLQYFIIYIHLYINELEIVLALYSIISKWM